MSVMRRLFVLDCYLVLLPGCKPIVHIVEFFHGISDGKGILRFINTLLYYYCQQKYGEIDPDDIPELILEHAPEDSEEYRESILFLGDCREHPIVAAMAVNARRAYGAEKTMQCCVATIPIWYDHEVAAKTLAEQLTCTKQMIKAGIQRENILAGAIRTKKFNEMLEAKCSSLDEKKQYCRQVAQQGLDRYTYGISCVGEVSFGKGIDEHVGKVTLMLCANTSPVILEITKYKDSYYITYCTHLKEDPYVSRLQELFLCEGIPCVCEQKKNYMETFAEF